MLRIIYDPLSYINKDRFSVNEKIPLTNVNKVVLNKMVFEIYSLRNTGVIYDRASKYWINNWFQIPEITFLIGCLSYKENLLWRGRIKRLPLIYYNAIKVFPYRVAPQVKKHNTEHLSDQDILYEGYSQIHGYLIELSEQLLKRINLMFPAPYEHSISNNKISPQILNSVFTYVKKNRSYT